MWDTTVPGLGLVVHPSGRKTWVYQGGSADQRKRTAIDAPNLAAARRAALAIKAGLTMPGDTGEPPVAPTGGGLTVNELLNRWLDAMALRPEPPVSLPRIQACMDNHVRPRIGSIRLEKLTRGRVLAVRDALAARGTRGMANQTVAYTRAALRWAEDAGLIAEAPRWRLPRLRLGTRAHALTDEQWDRLMGLLENPSAGLHPVGRLALLALVLTGCRKSEISTLRWSAVSPDGSILLERHKTSARSGPKRIPGSAQLLAVLEEARTVIRVMAERQPTVRLRNALLASDYVFPSLARNTMGRPLSTSLNDVWDQVRARADLPATMTIHGLRSAFITQAQRLGVPVATVAAMVGHENVITTLKHYTAPTHSELHQAAGKVATWILQRSHSTDVGETGLRLVPLNTHLNGYDGHQLEGENGMSRPTPQ
jgi:integrase